MSKFDGKVTSCRYICAKVGSQKKRTKDSSNIVSYLKQELIRCSHVDTCELLTIAYTYMDVPCYIYMWPTVVWSTNN